MNDKTYKSKQALEPIDIINNGGFEITVDDAKMTFFLEPHVSLQRYKMMQKLELEMSYSLSFKNLYEKLNDIYGTLNSGQFADSSVKVRDLIEGSHRIDDENNFPAIIKYASLVLNTDTEDRTVYDEQVMKNKINIWNQAGIPIQCFFAIALHSVSGLMESYKENIRNISQEKKKEEVTK